MRKLRRNIQIVFQNPYTSLDPRKTVGDETASVQAAHELGEQGWFVPAMRWPTVPRSRAILRVTVMATHTDDQIDGLADALVRLGLPRT